MMERLLDLVALPPEGMMLHQFGGSVVPNGLEHTVDLKPDHNPTYLTDARTLENVPDNTYHLVVADPPYDSLNIEYGPKLYDTEPVRPYSFVNAGVRVTKPGGFFAVLHQLTYKNLEGCTRFGVIGITTGPNMRIRCLNVFVKGEDPKFKQSSLNLASLNFIENLA